LTTATIAPVAEVVDIAEIAKVLRASLGKRSTIGCGLVYIRLIE
jgi:hypothetical protein